MSMAEEKKVQVEQIEGLDQYIRDQVQATLRQTAQPFLEDMEEIRKSPAGVLIRLEEQVEALDEKMEERFDSLRTEIDQRFGSLRIEMEQRFDAVDQRFQAIDQRFVDLQQSLGQQLTTLKWAFALIFPFLFAILGKLFLMP